MKSFSINYQSFHCVPKCIYGPMIDLEITLLISVFLVVDVKFLQIIKFFYQCLDLVSVASSSRRKNLRKLTAAVVQTFSSRLWWIFLYYASVCIQINYKFY